MFASLFSPVQSIAPKGFSFVFKDTEASKKAWLSRERAKEKVAEQQARYDRAVANPRSIPTSGDYKGWIPIVYKPGDGYVREDGKSLNAAQQKMLGTAKTPPNWRNAMLNPSATDGANLTRGQDEKGKWQSRQRPEAAAANAEVKWDRVRDFHHNGAGPIIRAAERLMKNETASQKERDLGALIHLVSRTGFRVGSDTDTGAKEQAYGASTLEKRHIKLRGKDSIDFEFTGKKAVTITKTLRDKALTDYLGGRLKEMSDAEKVFKATNEDALRFIKRVSGNSGYKTKDFRTWQGTGLALALRKKMTPPTTEKEWVEKEKGIAEAVAKHLGNTPKVALESYIAPYIFDKWDQSLRPKKVKGTKEESEPDFEGWDESGEFFPFQEIWDAMEEEAGPPPEPTKKGLSTIFKDGTAQRKAWKKRAKRTPTDLDARLVDFKPDRSLEGEGTSKIRDILPDVEHIAYSKVPFIDKMHELMGVKDPMTHDVADYMKRRDKLFDDQPVKNTPYDKVAVTQARVNDARVQQLIDDPKTGGKKPVQTVRYKGMTYIMNGHHRVVADLKQGAKEVESSVLTLD
jgi:DNA topoisomerase IB